MSAQRGLGRGLDTLFRIDKAGSTPHTGNDTEGDIRTLPIFKLIPGQGQPRQIFDEELLDELAASIRNQGVIQPLLVRPLADDPGERYEIVAGERRWRAAKRAGLSQLPVIVRDMSDDEALTVALVENLQREDLNPVEEAKAMATLRERLKLSQEELASRLGKSRPAVANTLRLLQLPEAMLEAIHTGELTAGHARSLLALNDVEAQATLYEAILEKGLSVRDAENAVACFKREGRLPVSVAGPAKPNARQPKPARLKNAQQQLRERLHSKVTVSGTDQAGKITIPYEGEEALRSLLHALGVDMDAPADPASEAHDD